MRHVKTTKERRDKPVRSVDNVTATISCQRVELDEIDARAASFGLTRSTYLVALARRDLQQREPLLMLPRPAAQPSPAADGVSDAPVLHPEVDAAADMLLLRPN